MFLYLGNMYVLVISLLNKINQVSDMTICSFDPLILIQEDFHPNFGTLIHLSTISVSQSDSQTVRQTGETVTRSVCSSVSQSSLSKLVSVNQEVRHWVSRSIGQIKINMWYIKIHFITEAYPNSSGYYCLCFLVASSNPCRINISKTQRLYCPFSTPPLRLFSFFFAFPTNWEPEADRGLGYMVNY